VNEWIQGTLRSADLPTDIAILGPGFIPLKNKKGEIFFTRQGSLSMNNKGELIHKLSGYNVVALNETGNLTPISLSGKGSKAFFKRPHHIAYLTKVAINGDGVISGLYSDGQEILVAKLQIALLENPRKLDLTNIKLHLLKPTIDSGKVAYLSIDELPLGKIYGKSLENLTPELYGMNRD
jgi:flagellar hook protein FlgE